MFVFGSTLLLPALFTQRICTRAHLKRAIALLAIVLIYVTNISYAGQNVLTETHANLQQNTAPTNLSAHIGEPFVLYIWDTSCHSCIQDLQTMNRLDSEDKIKAFSLLLRQNEEESITSIGESELSQYVDIPFSLHEMTHLYNPYIDQHAINATHLPEVRVFNRFGAVAARYPNFTHQWQEIQTLIDQLTTPEFAQYQMSDPTQQPSSLTTRADGNILNVKPINRQNIKKRSHLTTTHLLAPYVSEDQFGAPSRTQQRPKHSLALSTPMASIDMIFNSGFDVGPDWQGLSAQVIQQLDLDQRLLVSFDWLETTHMSNQLLGPGTISPSEQNLAVGYESYWGDIQFGASIFYRSLSYRDDTGIHFDSSHLFWNNRTQLTLGATLYNSSHEASTTLNAASKDRNRLHFISLSHTLNQHNAVTLSWHHDALQGVIQNPEELVQFQNGPTITSQFALYPPTRTLNNYILQWINREKTYGYSFYKDTWGIEQHQLFTEIQYQYKDWQLKNRAALTHQVESKFFNDLFPAQDAQSLLSRHPSHAGYDSLALIIQGDTLLAMKLWNKPTTLVLKGGLEYIDFEALSHVNDRERQPVTSLVFSTSIGLKLSL